MNLEKLVIPRELPQCKIIEQLAKKANEKINDNEFSYIHNLEQLRKRISIEVSRINELFPEYTPHDDKYHLKRLFYIASDILGDSLIEQMNVNELFLLSAALYAHDWGMAVSEVEKDYICNKKESKLDDINLLENEFSLLDNFCIERNIKIENISNEDWREYVRITHAPRSGKRVKSFFEKESLSIADFTARICEGHWLDFKYINNHNSYPSDASVNGEIVNVKALAIYVRLIDLLDIAEDRTPYILWKFISPRNTLSIMEWDKHRSLHPITINNYQDNLRYIQIDGSTDNLHVHVELMNLEKYVNTQFRQCLDILNQTNNSYHKLNISHINWRIGANGFEPINIRVEFDRDKMFDILGSEIYNGNPFVFLRELLQNAIDAITLRQEILQSKGMSFQPLIKIETRVKDNYIIVKITDNGIGMDEYIIRNYLAVAGKSYYNSADFLKAGLNMSPISKFGIGFLSCFMIADHVNIQTFKDPYTTDKSECLKIQIPAKDKYFIVEKNTTKQDIGTSIEVYVDKDKLPKDKDDKPINFNITEYIKRIAGFVKYPIVIHENGMQVTITHPYHNIGERDMNNVVMLDYSYPFDAIFTPQSVDLVKENFVEEIIDIKRDLKLDGYEGYITFLLPKNDFLLLVNTKGSWPATEAELIDHNMEKTKGCISWDREWSDVEHTNFSQKDEFLAQTSNCNIFMNGILLDKVHPPQKTISENLILDKIYDSFRGDTFSTEILNINITKSKNSKINIARTNIVTKDNWFTPIYREFLNYIKENIINKKIINSIPKEKLLEFAKLVVYFKIPVKDILEHVINYQEFILPFITKGGVIDYQIADTKKHQFIYALHTNYSYTLTKSFAKKIFEQQEAEELSNWEGQPVLLKASYGRNFLVEQVQSLTKEFIKRYYYCHSIKFISSPRGKDFPLALEVYHIRPNFEIVDLDAIDINNILGKKDYGEYDIFIMNIFIKKEFYSFPKLIKFPEKYSDKLFFSNKYLNANNKQIVTFLRICIAIIVHKKEGKIEKKITGRILDLIRNMDIIERYISEKKSTIENINIQMNELYGEVKKYHLLDWEISSDFHVTLNSFINNSISIKHDNIEYSQDYSNKLNNPWGNLISD
jgi:hypothetical protein